MPVEETENEIRVRVRQPGEFIRGSMRQLFPTDQEKPSLERSGDWPYNEEGVRAIGGRLRRNNEWEIQAFRFSKADKYDWTPGKAETWVRDHGHTPKSIEYDVDSEIKFSYSFGITAVKTLKQVPEEDRIEVEDGTEVIYIEGPASTDVVDRENDIIDQASIDIEEFQKNPILLFQHDQNNPIGRVVRIEKDKQMPDGTRALFIRAAIIGSTEKAREVLQLIKDKIVRAFSINGRARYKRKMRKGNKKINKLIGLRVFEISAVSVPANQRTLFSVVKSLMDDDNQDQEEVDFSKIDPILKTHGHEPPEDGGDHAQSEKEEHEMSEETPDEGAPEGATTKQELPSDLLQRLEAVEAWGERIAALEQQVQALTEAMAGTEEEMAEETEAATEDAEEKAEPQEGDVIETVTEDGTKKSLVLVDAKQVAKSVHAGKDAKKTEEDDILVQKKMAEAAFKAQHPQ